MSRASVVYTCPFVPVEWIAAHGFTPCRLLPHSSRTPGLDHKGLCSYVRAFMEDLLASEHSLVIFTTTCDQMRRGSELLARLWKGPVFLLNVPKTWQSKGAYDLYRSELRRLGSFLTASGGRPFSSSHLAEMMDVCESTRLKLRRASGGSSSHQFLNSERPSGIPIAVLGESVLSDQNVFYNWIEAAGGSVLLDGTGGGERTLPAPFDRDKLKDDPFEALVEAYFTAIPDAFRRPNTALYQWLERGIKERGIRGVILRYYVGCDIWKAEAQRLKEWTSIPVLALDAEEGDNAENRTRSRIEAFLEILR